MAEYPIEALAQETAGERFRKVMAQIDESCREMKLGPYLDTSDPEYRSKRRATDCDILKLEPRDWRTENMVQTEGQHYPVPERWLATPEGRFAHSIRLPAPHDKPNAVYRPGMTGREYFEALCRGDSGEFAFERVTGVTGIAQERQMPPLPRGYSDIAFHAVEPRPFLGDRPTGFLVGTSPSSLQFVEERLPTERRSDEWAYRRYIRTDVASPPDAKSIVAPSTGLLPEPRIREELTDRSVAIYAFTFRGIRRPEDWEHGIQGRELVVYRKSPIKVLGVKRTYTRVEPDNVQPNRRTARVVPCPQAVGKWELERLFIMDVLRPAKSD